MAALDRAKRVVIKIGSALLVGPDGALRSDWLTSLCDDVAQLRARGADVVLVSSGSIALGRGVLDLPGGVLPLDQSQAAAAVGQIHLAQAYQQALAPHGITAAQILVTLEDSADRRRYLNSRATLGALLAAGAVPIVNENDTVATDEIRYGDNDRLAAQVAVTAGADHLVLLSDVDGFYSANPQIDPTARRYDLITDITPEIESQAGDAASVLSRGGMRTKLMAAKMATAGGCAMAIADGRARHPVRALLQGGACTWFAAATDPQSARKAWIGSMKPAGQLTIDAGAASALAQGRSLLPAGVTACSGAFARGEAIQICGPDGADLGLGLAGYDIAEARMICGRQTAEIAEILGYERRAALVHRDDMALY